MLHGLLRKTAFVGALLLALFSAPGVLANHPDGGTFTVGTGDTVIRVMVMPTMYDALAEFELHTDVDTLVEALLEASLIEGYETAWGFNISAVDGYRADYASGGYWHVYRDMTLLHLADAVSIQTDDEFLLTLSAFWEEDEDGFMTLAANDLSLPWPDAWPETIPQMDGRIIAYFGGDAPEHEDGMGVGVEPAGPEAAEAFVDALVRQGFSAQAGESDVFPYLMTLTGFGYQITVAQDMEVTVHIRRLADIPG